MAEEKTTRERYEEIKRGEREPQGEEKGWFNFKPYEERTEEEKHRLAVQGGKARAKQRREQRTMKETLSVILSDTTIAKALAKANGNEILIQATEQGATVNDLLMLSAMVQGMDGNVKALEFIRDTNGQKPKEDLSIQADVITASDKALIEKLRKNLVHNDDGCESEE